MLIRTSYHKNGTAVCLPYRSCSSLTNYTVLPSVIFLMFQLERHHVAHHSGFRPLLFPKLPRKPVVLPVFQPFKKRTVLESVDTFICAGEAAPIRRILAGNMKFPARKHVVKIVICFKDRASSRSGNSRCPALHAGSLCRIFAISFGKALPLRIRGICSGFADRRNRQGPAASVKPFIPGCKDQKQYQ